jgi:hypothetical protein
MKASKLTKIALAVALATPVAAMAGSDITTGAGSPLTATVNLDFRIIIPKFVFLQVGTGTLLADNAAIDVVEWTPLVNQVGTGPLAANGAGVTARIIGNNGAITVNSNTPGALSNGAGDTIPYTDITAASTDFAHPAFAAAGPGTATVTVPNVGLSGKVTDRTATWTFTWANGAVIPAGTYGDIANAGANNSRVTYTASMP